MSFLVKIIAFFADWIFSYTLQILRCKKQPFPFRLKSIISVDVYVTQTSASISHSNNNNITDCPALHLCLSAPSLFDKRDANDFRGQILQSISDHLGLVHTCCFVFSDEKNLNP